LPFSGDAPLALGESELCVVVMTPPDIGVHDLVSFRHAQLDLTWNVNQIKNDDPCAFLVPARPGRDKRMSLLSQSTVRDRGKIISAPGMAKAKPETEEVASSLSSRAY
jgi:hypothetical protein